MDKTKNITEIPEWFAGSRLNYAENLLRCKDSNKTAIIECGTCVCVCVHVCVYMHVCVLTSIYTLLEAFLCIYSYNWTGHEQKLNHTYIHKSL